MHLQLATSVPPRPAPPAAGDTTMSLPEALDDDVRERMIVERAMRPRSWEPDGKG